MQGSILTPEFSDFLLDNGLSDAYLFMTLVPIAFGLLRMLHDGILFGGHLACFNVLSVASRQGVFLMTTCTPSPIDTPTFEAHPFFSGGEIESEVDLEWVHLMHAHPL